jgi:diadenosine tetraphosphate (Ap4A) HIT family hydrolase/5-methylcytosine-specific restriction endonuclease McrA
MSSFERLRQFVQNEMRMSQVYQPVMLLQLLKNNGQASIQQIAKAILDKDPTQIEYFSEIVKNMVGRVLTKNRGITEKVGNTYKLLGIQVLSENQVNELVSLCEQRIQDFERQRGGRVWNHRKRGHRPISGSVRYEVLSRAKFRCELCGISADERNIEVDHIIPQSIGGKNDLSNFQALCYSCNAAKGNTDDTDFRLFRSLYEYREENCLFCSILVRERHRIVAENNLAYAIRDGFPVTEGHSLFIPRRHVIDYFGLVPAERNAINSLMLEQKQILQKQDSSINGFNIGMNCGETAGQTIFHSHVHLIPRRKGDVANPRGGVRHIIAGKGYYEDQG